jgi:hypothetical protein
VYGNMELDTAECACNRYRILELLSLHLMIESLDLTGI